MLQVGCGSGMAIDQALPLGAQARVPWAAGPLGPSNIFCHYSFLPYSKLHLSDRCDQASD